MNGLRSKVRTLGRRAWRVHGRNTRSEETAKQPVVEQLAKVVCELRDLLHDYAPSWYSAEQHGRVESAIRRLSER